MKSRWCALGLFLLLFPATARAGDRHAKTAAEAAARVIADIRARISLNDLKQWWDGEAVASRVFSDSWDSLPPAVRAELGRVMAGLSAGELVQSLDALVDPKAGAPVIETGPPIPMADEDSLSAIGVSFAATAGGERGSMTVVFLATKSAKGFRIVDWHSMDRSSVVKSFRELRSRTPEPSDPLLWAYGLSSEAPGHDSVLFATPPPPAPEWATWDLPRIALPRVPGAARDVRLEVAPDSTWGPRMVVNMRLDGTVLLRKEGRRSPLAVVECSMFAPRTRAFDEIRGVFVKVASAQGMRQADGRSSAELVVRADDSVSWRRLSAVVKLAADPAVRFRAVSFVTAHGPDSQPGALRFDTAVLVPPWPATAHAPDVPHPRDRTHEIRIRMLRRSAEDPKAAFTEVSTAGKVFMLPVGVWAGDPAREASLAKAYEAALRPLLDFLREVKSKQPAGSGSTIVEFPMPWGAAVPVCDFLRVVQTVREAGLPLMAVDPPVEDDPAPDEGGMTGGDGMR